MGLNVAFDAKRRRRFLRLIERGCNRTAACKAVGISRATFYLHLKRDDEFKKKLGLATQVCCGHVENALYRTACEGNTTAQIFFLTNRNPGRWRDRRGQADQVDPSAANAVARNNAYRDAYNALSAEAQEALADKERVRLAAEYADEIRNNRQRGPMASGSPPPANGAGASEDDD